MYMYMHISIYVYYYIIVIALDNSTGPYSDIEFEFINTDLRLPIYNWNTNFYSLLIEIFFILLYSFLILRYFVIAESNVWFTVSLKFHGIVVFTVDFKSSSQCEVLWCDGLWGECIMWIWHVTVSVRSHGGMVSTLGFEFNMLLVVQRIVHSRNS